MGGAYKEVLSHSISDLKSEELWRFLLTMQRCCAIIATKTKRNSEVIEMLAFGTNNDEITAAPFLLSMTDHSDNELSIIIALAKRGEKGEGLDLTGFPPEIANKAKDLLLESYPVYEDTEQIYEIRFNDYIIYQCRNESYTCWDDSEVRKGRYLIIFEKSNLLDYYKSVLFDWDDDDTKSKRKHYGIYTENHIIDVISNTSPTITRINSDSTEQKL